MERFARFQPVLQVGPGCDLSLVGHQYGDDHAGVEDDAHP
jgi:hypothetical protein